jgi:isopenicillin-N N-acyltransferase-like protein
LNSVSAAAAISALEALGGVASSQHILIADNEGPIGFEVSPNGNVHLKPDSNGIVYHTNHFIENRLVDERPWLAGSPIRLERLKTLTSELVSSKEAPKGEVLRRKVFSDTYNAPQAICCKEDPTRPLATRSSTLFCIVMNFAKGTKPSAELVWGQPGSGEEGEVLSMPW